MTLSLKYWPTFAPAASGSVADGTTYVAFTVEGASANSIADWVSGICPLLLALWRDLRTAHHTTSYIALHDGR